MKCVYLQKDDAHKEQSNLMNNNDFAIAVTKIQFEWVRRSDRDQKRHTHTHKHTAIAPFLVPVLIVKQFTASCHDEKDTSGHWKTSFFSSFLLFLKISPHHRMCHWAWKPDWPVFRENFFFGSLKHHLFWNCETEGHWNIHAHMICGWWVCEWSGLIFIYIMFRILFSLVIKFDSFIFLFRNLWPLGKCRLASH